MVTGERSVRDIGRYDPKHIHTGTGTQAHTQVHMNVQARSQFTSNTLITTK